MEDLIGVEEAAAQLGVSGRRVRQLIEADQLPARRVGNIWLIPASEVPRRQRVSPGRGRPYKKQSVWKLAAYADVAGRRVLDVLADEPARVDEVLERQGDSAPQLEQSLRRLKGFGINDLIDQPERIAELQNILDEAQRASSREPLLAGWIKDCLQRLREYESRAEIDSGSIGHEWLVLFGEGPAHIESDAGSMRALRRLIGSRAPGHERSLAILRSRSNSASHFYAHPSMLESLSEDEGIAQSGERAAAAYGGDLVPGRHVHGYIGGDIDIVVRKYALQEAGRKDGNVSLQIVDVMPGPHPHFAPRLFVAADLLESDDPRSRNEGAQLLDALVAALLVNEMLGRWKSDSPR